MAFLVEDCCSPPRNPQGEVKRSKNKKEETDSKAEGGLVASLTHYILVKCFGLLQLENSPILLK